MDCRQENRPGAGDAASHRPPPRFQVGVGMLDAWLAVDGTESSMHTGCGFFGLQSISRTSPRSSPRSFQALRAGVHNQYKCPATPGRRGGDVSTLFQHAELSLAPAKRRRTQAREEVMGGHHGAAGGWLGHRRNRGTSADDQPRGRTVRSPRPDELHQGFFAGGARARARAICGSPCRSLPFAPIALGFSRAHFGMLCGWARSTAGAIRRRGKDRQGHPVSWTKRSAPRMHVNSMTVDREPRTQEKNLYYASIVRQWPRCTSHGPARYILGTYNANWR